MSLTLSILDQSSISEGGTAEQGLEQTVELAQLADRLGFKRFWVSEHHDTPTLAGSSPEVLIAHLAAKTERIKVGSGGVMLPHYSAYKVAENFKVLEGLTPGRIDVGIGRAPGGMPRASYALSDGKPRDVNRYPEQVAELLQYLHDDVPEDHPYGNIKATPVTQTVPDLWMLGSSPSSAALAAEMGVPYTFALFINGQGGPSYTQQYLRRFKPSKYYRKPKHSVAVFTICGETMGDAERIASSLDLSMVMLEQGMPSKGTPSPEKAMSYDYSHFERLRILENRKRMVIGDVDHVEKELHRLAEEYDTDEIMLTTIAYDFEDKLNSFKRIAERML
ncbi:LLM class flavin-dependent oxidoreductase [Jeotgalibacillus haloalkalitolerans]|uniref:LLM class flavin-dependent oxidoreductase n=1 Tax=Jeotgalibacillus haloalkalitolerans TaxID=3104292 RepID=A0ABU5KNL7_9BACL|nr:LLM class flavin-dependent oxidoreductase [Jeotgalibacillus sp. HH7-29]MDZ5712541.1 LLM class flavin-dependent oxidoreductase [Jeotgalibacillus sp. HH7-29]